MATGYVSMGRVLEEFKKERQHKAKIKLQVDV